MADFSNVESGVDTHYKTWQDIEKDSIKGEEGLRLSSYRDSLGYWTIGWGHHDSTIGADMHISLEQAIQYLEEDFEDSISAAKRLCATFDSLNGCRKGVIVQMIFQMGEDGVKKFVNTLHAIDREDWETASRNMKASLWAKQTPFRARRLADRMKTGEYE